MPSKKRQHIFRLTPKAEAGLDAWLGGMGISERIERLILGSSVISSRIDQRILIEEARSIRADIKRTGAMIMALLQAAQLSQTEREKLIGLCERIAQAAEDIRIDPFWDRSFEDRDGSPS